MSNNNNNMAETSILDENILDHPYEEVVAAPTPAPAKKATRKGKGKGKAKAVATEQEEADTAEKKRTAHGKVQGRKEIKKNVTRSDVESLCVKEVPFAEWAGVRGLPQGHPKAKGTTSYAETVFAVGRLFKMLDDQKFKDPDKYMPRQCRLDLIAEEVRNSGSTQAPSGKNASWKHEVKKDYQFNLEMSTYQVSYDEKSLISGQVETIPELLLLLPDTLYSKPSDTYSKTVAAYVGWHNKKNPELKGTHVFPPMTPLEDIYRVAVEAHVDEMGNHRGRDATYENVNMVRSSTINKEFVGDFVALCPTCKAKQEGMKAGAEKRATTMAAKKAGVSMKRARSDSVDDELQQPAPKRSRQEPAMSQSQQASTGASSQMVPQQAQDRWAINFNFNLSEPTRYQPFAAQSQAPFDFTPMVMEGFQGLYNDYAPAPMPQHMIANQLPTTATINVPESGDIDHCLHDIHTMGSSDIDTILGLLD